jgi:fatty acid desaturase
MSLSDHDQEIFAQMEKQFNADRGNKRATSTPLKKRPKQNKARSTVLGILAIVAGIAILVLGVAMAQMWLGVIGFAAMFGGGLMLANIFLTNIDYGMPPHIR